MVNGWISMIGQNVCNCFICTGKILFLANLLLFAYHWSHHRVEKQFERALLSRMDHPFVTSSQAAN
jgi:hypothetical protein